MEYHFDRSFDDTETFLARKDELIIAAASVVDSAITHRVDKKPTRPEFRAFWRTDDRWCYLTARSYLRQSDPSNDPPKVIFDTDYTLSESQHLSGLMHAKYWFSTSTNKVYHLDAHGESIGLDSFAESSKNLDAALRILSSRPEQTPINEEIIGMELDYYLADDDVQNVIERLARAHRHSMQRQKLMSSLVNLIDVVMDKRPLFTKEAFEERLRTEQERLREAA